MSLFILTDPTPYASPVFLWNCCTVGLTSLTCSSVFKHFFTYASISPFSVCSSCREMLKHHLFVHIPQFRFASLPSTLSPFIPFTLSPTVSCLYHPLLLPSPSSHLYLPLSPSPSLPSLSSPSSARVRCHPFAAAAEITKRQRRRK